MAKDKSGSIERGKVGNREGQKEMGREIQLKKQGDIKFNSW